MTLSAVPTAGGTLKAGQDAVKMHHVHGATILALHCVDMSAEATVRGRDFGEQILTDLARENLLGHVFWTTGCTPAQVELRCFRRLSEAGLFLVRLDLGGRPGPDRLRTASAAMQTLGQLGILVEYDVELFGPTPRFSTVLEAAGFLRSIVCDGSTPARFGLPIAPGLSYSPWLGHYLERLRPAVEPWLGDEGLSAQLAEAWAEVVVAERLLRGLADIAAHRIRLQRLTMRSNTELLGLVEAGARDFERYGDSERLDPAAIAPSSLSLAVGVRALRDAFVAANAHALIGGQLRI